MKVCSYCGTENPNNAVICENCGAHELKHKCNNCGTIYSEGEFCPRCGVKANQRPRVCPNCGREYYSNACPTCGYVKGGGENGTTRTSSSTARGERSTKRTGRSAAKVERSTPGVVTPPEKPVKKRKTWLWVLGWIFIFPLPLTILLVRNKKMNKVIKIIILAVVWLFYLLIVLAANSDSSSSSTSGTDPSSTRTEASSSSNIKSMKFLRDDSISIVVGESKAAGGYLKVKAKNSKDLVPEDVVFVSENPEIATIALDSVALNDCFYCDVTGVGAGETRVYATSKDGTIVSDYLTVTVENNIKSLDFNRNDDVLVRVGETKSAGGYLKVDAKRSTALTSEDVIFVSENPEVATIAINKLSYGSYYCDVTGVGEGETRVYASSKDGTTVSNYINVIVPKPILVESIDIQNVKTDLAIGEKTTPSVTISPSDADNKSITWSSSDEAVATVDSKGTVTAVGGGTTDIVATSRDGVSSSYTVNVDSNRHLMKVYVTHPRQDNVNIGDEWSHMNEINGECASGTIGLAPGETITLHTRISEDDDNPDIGENTVWYTPSEADLTDGFNVSMDVYVTENGGKNSGQSAHFIVTYSFTPAN